MKCFEVEVTERQSHRSFHAHGAQSSWLLHAMCEKGDRSHSESLEALKGPSKDDLESLFTVDTKGSTTQFAFFVFTLSSLFQVLRRTVPSAGAFFHRIRPFLCAGRVVRWHGGRSSPRRRRSWVSRVRRRSFLAQEDTCMWRRRWKEFFNACPTGASQSAKRVSFRM